MTDAIVFENLGARSLSFDGQKVCAVLGGQIFGALVVPKILSQFHPHALTLKLSIMEVLNSNGQITMAADPKQHRFEAYVNNGGYGDLIAKYYKL